MNVSVKNCYYTGSVAGHLFSRVSMSMCDGEMVRKELEAKLLQACTTVPLQDVNYIAKVGIGKARSNQFSLWCPTNYWQYYVNKQEILQ